MEILSIVLIRQDEVEWSFLDGTAVAKQLSYVTQEALDHALHGWSTPLVQALGPPPKGALIKLALSVDPTCAAHKICGTWRSELCYLKSKKIPLCFELVNHAGFANEVVRWWHEGIYVLVGLL